MSDRRLLRVCAVLFGALAVSNVLKPLELHPQHGFVFLGLRQHGLWNVVLGPAAGALLAVYALALWRGRAVALPIGRAYAAWVVVNLALFTVRMTDEALARPVFGLVYAVVAIGVSSGCAVLLAGRGVGTERTRRRPASGEN
ncbi:MAG: hypothetical protein IT294_00035 [Deltaproteobacteria bacterium]|nr:hypothetical protein [Deltaproteobacteria bacterium]